MEFIAPTPFVEAIKKLGDQQIVASSLSSSEWQDLPQELRDNAYFSSRVESAQFLQRSQDVLGDFLAGNRKTSDGGELMLATGSRAAFVSQMQGFLEKEGVKRGGGGLTDITSEKRLGLIFNIKAQQSQDFAAWLQGMNPSVLNEFPAARFIRVKAVKEPRQSHEQYQDQVYLKTDPIWWLVINKDFGVPYGPWGWGCGHDVEDVDRDETESLGLIKAGDKVVIPAAMQKFLKPNQNLQASMKNLAPELLQKLKDEFGEKIVIEGDTMRWRGQPAGEFGEQITDEERRAINGYTQSGYKRINRLLREGDQSAYTQ
ncbi:MAG TPA: ADP-ribosyltransferase, partial [Verrucomicrobiae bacterium]